jgi:hypothetical protein
MEGQSERKTETKQQQQTEHNKNSKPNDKKKKLKTEEPVVYAWCHCQGIGCQCQACHLRRGIRGVEGRPLPLAVVRRDVLDTIPLLVISFCCGFLTGVVFHGLSSK